MRFAYADPPYVGQARKHYKDDPKCAEVDMGELVRDLDRSYDGWALSMSATIDSLNAILPHLPSGARVASWVKPFASFKRGVDPAWTWEPVIFKTARKWDPKQNTCRDHIITEHALIENITMKNGLSGVKPERFSFWLFDLLGMKYNDQFVDVFPGSGAVTEAWRRWASARAPELCR